MTKKKRKSLRTKKTSPHNHNHHHGKVQDNQMIVPGTQLYSEKVVKAISHYQWLERLNSNSLMIKEVRWQYRDMSQGGDGGSTGIDVKGKTSCRDVNYPGYPDQYFREVCVLMGWDT